MCPRPRGWGWGQGARTTPDVAEANRLGRWVIYEVLKSIFEAVIYLRALSLNKHRICLIIVTVETQHPNGLASAAASPCPAQLRPGPGARSAHSCTLAACLSQAPRLILPPASLSSSGSLRLTRAPTSAHPCKEFAKSRGTVRPAGYPHLLHPSGGCRSPRGPLAGMFPRFPWPGSFLGL